jgi:alpha-1,3-rhamnosyl/mannosyltransferase
VDAACWANGRGYGRFARELLRAKLESAPDDEFIFFADPLSAERLKYEAGNYRVVEVAQRQAPAIAAAADGNRSPADMLRFTLAVRRERPDVMFFPSVYSFFPLMGRQRAVVTVHDAIAERFPELTLPSRRARLFWNAKVWLALRQSRLVLTISRFAAREIEEVLRVPRSRIRVAEEAPAPEYRPTRDPAAVAATAARYGVPPDARWFVYVGGFNPHKNVDALVRAHGALAAARNGDAPRLLLVGTVTDDVFHGDQAHIRAEVAAAGSESLVTWTGWMPDEELRDLHTGAVALVLPSQCEGFGLPAVEAAACGTPVIATNQSPLPELLRGGGHFVSPRDEKALSAAMASLLDNPAERALMGERARQGAAALSWKRGAQAALSALREAAA